MPLMEAAGTSVDRISPDSVKNSTPPERSWLSVSVSEPSWLEGKIWRSRRPLVSFLIASAISRARMFIGMRGGQVVGVLVGELGRLSARHERRSDGAAESGGPGEQMTAGQAHRHLLCGRATRPCFLAERVRRADLAGLLA